MSNKVIDATLRFVDQFSAPLKKAVGTLEANATKITKVGKNIESAGKQLTSVGKSLSTKVTAPLAAAGVACVKVAADFEESMDAVAATLGPTNATTEAMEALTEKAKEMGAVTKFSASDSAEAFNYMAMAGWDTADMLNSIESVMYLAGASGSELATVSDILTDSMTALGYAADEEYADGVSNAAHFADVLAAASSSSNTNVEMLGESFKYCAPLAGQYGFDVESTALALGLMANSGIKASSSGTAFRTILAAMSDDIKVTQANGEALTVTTQNADGSMRDLTEICDDLRTAFNGVSEEEKALAENNLTSAAKDLGVELVDTNGALKDQATLYNEVMEACDGLTAAGKVQQAESIAGKTAMAGLLTIVGASEEDYNNLKDSIYDCNGAVEEMYKTATDNLNGRLAILKSTIESVAMSFGNILIPYVEKGVAVIQNLGDKFNSLSDSQKETIVKFAAMAAAVGPVLLVVGKFTTSIGKSMISLGDFGKKLGKSKGNLLSVIGPVGKIKLIIIAVVAVTILLVKHWDKVVAVFKKFQKFSAKALKACNIDLGKLKEKFSMIATQITSITSKLAGYIQAIFSAVSGWVSDHMDEIKAVFEFTWNGIVNYMVGIGSALADVISGLLSILSGLIDFLVGVFTGDWEQAWSGLADIVSGIFTTLVGVVKIPINAIISITNGVIDIINGMGLKIPDWVPIIGGEEYKINISSIPMLYKGTDNWGGGPAMIHDRGAEIVDLPSGSRVYPHDKSIAMAKAEGAASGGNSISIAKLADSIVVRESADIDNIVNALVTKLEKVMNNSTGVYA